MSSSTAPSCPACGRQGSRVLETRPVDCGGGRVITRRTRFCLGCRQEFSTHETVVPEASAVVVTKWPWPKRYRLEEADR